MESKITEQLIIDIRNYIRQKTGVTYFKDIRNTGDNLIVTCPFHKQGQEKKPSASIRVTPSNKVSVGFFNCFQCHESMPLDKVLEKILGSFYNSDEIESLFHLKSMIIQSTFINNEKQKDLFEIPDRNNYISESILREYRFYHPYLSRRNISIETANKYDIGYDKVNNQITFPIRDIYKNCLAIGRRSIDNKIYRYPYQFQKPLYGIYELNQFINYLFVVEGPFNLWSLSQWGKQGVALLGTGTEYQYNELLKIKCNGFICSLDSDEAGIRGTIKLINFLLKHNISNILVAVYPEHKDVNDLSFEEFKNIPVLNYKTWLSKFNEIDIK